MKRRIGLLKLALIGLSGLSAGCSLAPMDMKQVDFKANADLDAQQRDCLLRAMYFESNRSSEQGLLAVGTVVMNRLKSGVYPDTVCGVVGQPGQFATGALKRPVAARESGLAEKVADKIIEGDRLAGLEQVMFFHTAGYHFPYHNMHYVMVAGGNAFYYKNNRHLRSTVDEASDAKLEASATPDQTASPAPSDPAK